jgi:plasmid stabilization system protein ParE
LKIRWTQDALAQLRAIQDWLEGIEGANPARVTSAIRTSVNKLRILGDIGRPGIIVTTREISVRGQPYVVVYQVERTYFKIVAIFHTAQDR